MERRDFLKSAVAGTIAASGDMLMGRWTNFHNWSEDNLLEVEKGWIKFGNLLGWINTRIILTLLFALVVTPIGAISRLFRDPLDRRMGEDKPTYWLPRKMSPVRPESYERQF